MKKIVSVVMVAFFALTVPALAGIDEGNGEIGFDYGNTDYDSNTGLDSSDSLSLRGGYFWTRMFEIEGQYISADESTFGADVDMDFLMVNGVFNFHPSETIVPFVMVGVGRANVDVSGFGFSQGDSSLAYQVAGGTRWFFGKSQRAALRFDLSFVNEDTFNQSSTHTTFAGGFSWKLGN